MALVEAVAVTLPRAARRLGSPLSIKALVLLLVAENDTGSRRTFGRDTHEGMQVLASRLRDAGVNVKSIVYPPFENDGHTYFLRLGTTGRTWCDFSQNTSDNPSANTPFAASAVRRRRIGKNP